MKYEERIVTSDHSSTPVVKGTKIVVIDILRMLEEGKTSDEVIKAYPQLSASDVSACVEYATELVIISDFKNSTKKINEHFKKRNALADRIRGMKGKPPVWWTELEKRKCK